MASALDALTISARGPSDGAAPVGARDLSTLAFIYTETMGTGSPVYASDTPTPFANRGAAPSLDLNSAGFLVHIT